MNVQPDDDDPDDDYHHHYNLFFITYQHENPFEHFFLLPLLSHHDIWWLNGFNLNNSKYAKNVSPWKADSFMSWFFWLFVVLIIIKDRLTSIMVSVLNVEPFSYHRFCFTAKYYFHLALFLATLHHQHNHHHHHEKIKYHLVWRPFWVSHLNCM